MQSSIVSKTVIDEDDINVLSLSVALFGAKISLCSGLPIVSRKSGDMQHTFR